MAAGRSDPWFAVVDELKKLHGRLTTIESRLASIETKQRRVANKRTYFLTKIKKLQVEKQGLRNYIKELEQFNGLPTGEHLQ